MLNALTLGACGKNGGGSNKFGVSRRGPFFFHVFHGTAGDELAIDTIDLLDLCVLPSYSHVHESTGIFMIY